MKTNTFQIRRGDSTGVNSIINAHQTLKLPPLKSVGINPHPQVQYPFVINPGNNAKKTIYVGNLPAYIHHQTIRNYFNTQGKIELMFYKRGQNYAFIRYSTELEAKEARRKMDQRIVIDKRVKVDWARRELRLGEVKDRGTDKVKVWKGSGGRRVIKLFGNAQLKEELKWSVLLVDKQYVSMRKIEEILSEEGIEGAVPMRWGKYGVVVTCEDELSFNLCLQLREKRKGMFVLVQKFHTAELKLKRFVWLEVLGMPVETWTEESIDELGKSWGKWLHIAKQSEDLGSIDKLFMFLETDSLCTIDEILVAVYQNKEFHIRVKELQEDEDLQWESASLDKLSSDEMAGTPFFKSSLEPQEEPLSKDARRVTEEVQSSNLNLNMQENATEEGHRDKVVCCANQANGSGVRINNIGALNEGVEQEEESFLVDVQGLGQEEGVSNYQVEAEVEPPVTSQNRRNMFTDEVQGLEEVFVVPDTNEVCLNQVDIPYVTGTQYPQVKKHHRCTNKTCENLKKKAEERKTFMKSKAAIHKNSIRRGSRKGNLKWQEEQVQLQDGEVSEDISEEDEWENTAVQIGKEVGANLKKKGNDDRYDPLWKDFVGNILSREKLKGGIRLEGVTQRLEESQTPPLPSN